LGGGRVRCGDRGGNAYDAGFAVEHPPEDWLFKARSGNGVVDVLHRINGVRVEPATLECAEGVVRARRRFFSGPARQEEPQRAATVRR
jgi:hypothetical protein